MELNQLMTFINPAPVSTRSARCTVICPRQRATRQVVCAQSQLPEQSPQQAKLLDDLYVQLSASPSSSAIPSSESLASGGSSVTEQIEAIEACGSVPENLATNERLRGTWRVVSTTRPATASIIQRTILNLVPIVDQLIIGPPDEAPKYIVTRVNLSRFFGSEAALNLKAVIENFEANRIYLRFDSGWFSLFGGGLVLPYPVPFRLLGKKACGWQDITVLTDKFRLLRGNKGTSFVLRKIPQDDEEAKLFPITEDVLEACRE